MLWTRQSASDSQSWGTVAATATQRIPADLAEAATPRLLQQDLQEKGIQIDFLVNNAGIAGPDLLEDRHWAPQAAFFQLMMLSIAELCHLFIPAMRERGFGRVINVASVAGRLPSSGACNYGPSKAWVIALSEELALTVADDGRLASFTLRLAGCCMDHRLLGRGLRTAAPLGTSLSLAA